MPANLTPQSLEAELKFKEARTSQERSKPLRPCERKEAGMKLKRVFSRRRFLRGVLGGLLFSLLSPKKVRVMAGSILPRTMGENRSIARLFGGEELVYEIGFWFFRRVALGRLSFKEIKGKGQYLATLQAETLGVFGWLSHYRSDMYSATVEEIEGGRRLRPLEFEEKVTTGNQVEKRVTQFDYVQRKWITVYWGRDGTLQRVEEEFPSGRVYDDFLTASYNFRYGAYGPVEKGRTYSIPAFSRKGANRYEVRVASRDEEETQKRSGKGKERREFFVQFRFEPEITHSREGLIEGWLSKDLLPVEGKLKDVSVIGDVKGVLVENHKQSSK